MNYNNARMTTAWIFLLAMSARAAAPASVSADSATVKLAEYFVRTPVPDENPHLVEPFLAVNADTLPARLREKALARQLELRSLLRLHDTKKKGNWLQPASDCDMHSFIKHFHDMPAYQMAGYVPITEDEEKYIMGKTHCTELDMGCQFTLTIFYDKGRPRRLMLHMNDPLDALAAESHHPGGQTNFFGVGLTCAH